MPNEEISSLREMVRRRAYVVRERSKLRVKIRDCLVYNGIRKSEDSETSKGLFTSDGVAWLRSLNLEPIDMYVRLIEALDGEINILSKKLKGRASEDEDVKLLTTIPGVGYYSALLIKSEIGEIDRFPKWRDAMLIRGARSIDFFLWHSHEIWSDHKTRFQMAKVDHDRSGYLSRYKERYINFAILPLISSEEGKADSCCSYCEEALALLLFSTKEQKAKLRSGRISIASSGYRCVFSEREITR